jgi:hypothetical protein
MLAIEQFAKGRIRQSNLPSGIASSKVLIPNVFGYLARKTKQISNDEPRILKGKSLIQFHLLL